MSNRFTVNSRLFVQVLLTTICVVLLVVRIGSANSNLTNRAVTRQVRLVHSGFICTVQMQAVASSFTEDEAESWWGAYSTATSPRTTNYAVSSLGVQYKGKSLFVPASAWSALMNVYSGEIIKTGTGHTIILRGGDAACGYKVQLMLQRAGTQLFIKQRLVRLGEFPDKNWEQTTFSAPDAIP